ncbi:MAG: HEAT repeat domain-containing protein [Kofleriaceae bacterium]
MAALVSSAAPAHAEDRVAQLTKMLSSSSSDKARLSAVAALARLGNRRAVKPLIKALGDPSPEVRAVAAAALGRIGHKSSLDALMSSSDDSNPTVREKARTAARAVARTNGLPNPFPAAPGSSIATAQARHSGGRAGFGRQGHAVEAHPDLYVMINSAADDSPGHNNKVVRQQHADILRQTMADSFRTAPMVTTVAADAARWGLDPRQLDVAVVKMDVSQRGGYIEVEAQLRLAISDGQGKMLSFLNGGAKVQVPKRTFDARNLPTLRREALQNAARGMFDKLLAHLRDHAQS